MLVKYVARFGQFIFILNQDDKSVDQLLNALFNLVTLDGDFHVCTMDFFFLQAGLCIQQMVKWAH